MYYRLTAGIYYRDNYGMFVLDDFGYCVPLSPARMERISVFLKT